MTWRQVDLSKVHRIFYPQVPIIVTVKHDQRIGAMPAIWCMPASFNPPLVAVAIAPEHETYRMIQGARAFALNWLDFSYAERVGVLGETSSKEFKDKLASVGLTTIPGEKTSQPLILEASAALECVLSDHHKTGTHELLVAEVTSGAVLESFTDYWNFTKYNPILYAGTVTGNLKSWFFMSLHGENAKISLKRQT